MAGQRGAGPRRAVAGQESRQAQRQAAEQGCQQQDGPSTADNFI